MCGIIGYICDESLPRHGSCGPAAYALLRSLSKLEYRGYDSAGVTTFADGRLWTRKDIGKLGEVQCKHALDRLPGLLGIGHVRWATHGGVTPLNAHPHLDCAGRIAVVHNGIIDNYEDLRRELRSRHVFTSETDTEVVPHLIEDFMDGGATLEQAVQETIKRIRGSFALAVVSAGEPDKIIAARKDSPLVLGVAEGCNYVASDVLAFLEVTNRVVYLESNEMAVVKKDSVTLLDRNGHAMNRTAECVDWHCEEATKQGHPYYMIKEIKEEPRAIHRALEQNQELVNQIAGEIMEAKQVVITACGSSRYAGLIGRYLFSKLAGKFCDVIMGSEFHYFADSIDEDTIVIAISQSGETADVMEGVRRAKEKGARIVSLVNVVGSSLARMSDRVLYLNCGPEIGVAATKSFISQLVLLYMLAFAMAKDLPSGVRKIEAMGYLIEENLRENGLKLEELAQATKHRNDFYYIARGINFAIASEGALKLKELAYIHAEGMPAGELKHGTLALIEQGTPVVVICPTDYTYEETLANAAETRARGAFNIGVSNVNSPVFDAWIRIPKVEDIFYPLAAILPLQLLAFHLAVARGNDPDKPRNLAKSVTVK